MYYVYLLKSVHFPNQTYIGFSSDLKKGYKHNTDGSVHTAKYKPWILHSYFAFDSKVKALEFEKYLKSHSGRAFANKRLW